MNMSLNPNAKTSWFFSFYFHQKELIFEQTPIYALAWFLQHKTTNRGGMVIEKRIFKSILFFLKFAPLFIIGPCVAVSTNLNQFHMLAQFDRKFDRKYNILVGFKMSLMVSIMYTFYEICA